MDLSFLKNIKIKKYIFLTSLIYLIYAFILLTPDGDWDLWARLAVGAIFFQTGTVLKHDIFAYTPTKELWVDHEWGSGVIFYYLAHNFGDLGLILLRFFVSFIIIMLIFKINELRYDETNKNSDPYRIFYYLLFIFAIFPAFDNTIRSQSFTYLFFALWLYMLDLVRMGKNRIIWTFPATMVIWTNLHGGFLAGLGIVAAYAIGEALNRRSFLKYIGIFISSGLATLINPYGIKYWYFLIDAVTMNRPYVAEWDPINLFGPIRSLLGFKIFLFLTIFSLIFLLIKRFKQINWAEILILAITLYMSLKHQRHIIFFIIASSAYIYNYIYPAFDFFTWNIIGKFYSLFPVNFRLITKASRDFVIYSLIITFTLLVSIVKPMHIVVNQNKFPAKAVKFIQINHLSGNLLVLFNWGSYALWKLYPQNLIAVDGRYEEVYPRYFMDDVARFHYMGVGWNGLLTKYHADLMLIPVDYDVYKYLKKLKNWKIVYEDEQAAIFIPINKDRGKWVHPDKKFDPSKEKFISNIKLR